MKSYALKLALAELAAPSIAIMRNTVERDAVIRALAERVDSVNKVAHNPVMLDAVPSHTTNRNHRRAQKRRRQKINQARAVK